MLLSPRVTLRAFTSAVVLGALVLGLAGCGDDPAVVSVKPPPTGACYALALDDIHASTNSDRAVPCGEAHTAQTYQVATFGPELDGAEADDKALGAAVYDTCQKGFIRYVGGTDSLVMRSVLTWAWFRPSDAAWKKGARWFRCDVVGGGEQSGALEKLPEDAQGLLLGRPDDRWMVCVAGDTVSGSPKIPCSRKHTWRAVTTIVLGKAADPYPGDRLVEVRSRDFCSDSVGAWLNYPVDYEYGFTWFHEPEWKAGNRRSICWARTAQ